MTASLLASLAIKTTELFSGSVDEVFSGINIKFARVKNGQVQGGITRPWDFRRARRSATIPDGSAPGGRRYRCSDIGSYAKAQELLAEGHSYLDGNGDGEACESLR
jgi:hypothetical protein